MATGDRGEIDEAVAAAVANAAVENIDLEPDEQELIRRHQRGEISTEDFLAAARELAQRKATPQL